LAIFVATVTVNVIPPLPNTPPVANDDSVSTPQDTPITIDVLSNDTDADSDPLTIFLVDPTETAGFLVDNGDNVTYTPPPGFTGTDTFGYIATDGTDQSDVATVTITVNVVDTIPPVITLTGANPQTIELGSGYTELGATTDDGSPVTIDSSAFVDAVGSYSILYDSVDASGNVFVTGASSDNAFKITPDGTITEIIDSTGDGGGNILNAPFDIATDSSGNVFVTGFFSANAFKITPDGTITEIIDSTGDGGGNTLDAISYIATDSSGNVFVTGGTSSNAFKITPDGTITEIIDSTGDGGGNTLDNPRHIAIDSSGNVFVIGGSSDNAFKITPDGTITEIIDSTGDGGGNTLDGPFGIAIDSSDNVFVPGDTSNNAFKITPDGTITEIIDSTGGGNTLDTPFDIATDSSDNVFVTGASSDNAFKITPGGTITEIIDSTGDGGGNTLNFPVGIAIDSSGNAATQVIRTVNVVDTIPPVITLTGANPQTIQLGNGYTELGATTDDGSPVTIDSSAFVDAVGSYSILYDSVDASSNAATQLTRTVNVVDAPPPTPIITSYEALNIQNDGTTQDTSCTEAKTFSAPGETITLLDSTTATCTDDRPKEDKMKPTIASTDETEVITFYLNNGGYSSTTLITGQSTGNDINFKSKDTSGTLRINLVEVNPADGSTISILDTQTESANANQKLIISDISSLDGIIQPGNSFGIQLTWEADSVDSSQLEVKWGKYGEATKRILINVSEAG